MDKGSVATLTDRWQEHRYWAHFLIARGNSAVAEKVGVIPIFYNLQIYEACFGY